MNYKIVCAPSCSESKIEALIEQCSTQDDIQALLDQNLFTIERLDMPCGSLRKEHLEKALQIAQYFGTAQVLPDIPLLRKLSSKVVASHDTEIKVDRAQIVQYFKDTYPDLKLNDSQWERVARKLNLEDFISIDRMAEKAVLIWNSIPGIKTTNSCTGHRDTPRYFCFSNLFMRYDPEKISLSQINDLSQSAFEDLNSDIFKAEVSSYNNNLDITFYQIPSSKWIEKNNKISVQKLVNKCYKQIKTTFSTVDDREKFEHEKATSTARAADYIHKLLFKYFNLLNTNFEIDDDEDDLFWRIFMKRCLVFEEAYKGYYLSSEAIENIELFWRCCEELGRKLQSMV